MHATQASCFFSWRARLKVPAGSWSLGDPDEALGVGLDVEAEEILLHSRSLRPVAELDLNFR